MPVNGPDQPAWSEKYLAEGRLNLRACRAEMPDHFAWGRPIPSTRSVVPLQRAFTDIMFQKDGVCPVANNPKVVIYCTRRTPAHRSSICVVGMILILTESRAIK